MLVVEDDGATNAAMQAILRHHGYQPAGAKTVADALRLIAEPPDCLVLDIMLPDGEGTAVLRHVRQFNLPTRVIVTTGVADPQILATISDLKPDAFLRKPIAVGELIRLLKPDGGTLP